MEISTTCSYVRVYKVYCCVHVYLMIQIYNMEYILLYLSCVFSA